MKILIIAGLPDFVPMEKFDKYVGVDAGARWQLPVDLAVGDFDSVSSEGISGELLKLPEEKNETDLEVALAETFKRWPEAEVLIIGALGGRLDHELTNIYLPTTKKFRQFATQIQLENLQNTIRYYSAGRHIVPQIPGQKYIGFVKIGVENFSIENAKYPLKAEDNFAEIYASNEFISETMIIAFSKGLVIAIYSNDKGNINENYQN